MPIDAADEINSILLMFDKYIAFSSMHKKQKEKESESFLTT